jgi:hypothetical protein
MEYPKMYLLVFKKPSVNQINSIRSTFSSFDWDAGFAVEAVIANDILNDNLVIQFVSSKEFVNDNQDFDEVTLFPDSIESTLIGKAQFLGTLLSLGEEIERLDSYFGFLGNANEKRNPENEVLFKVEYDKYSILHKLNISLESLLEV